MKLPLTLRCKFIVRAMRAVFSRWLYVLLAIVTTLIMSGAIIWSLNLDLLYFVVFEAPVPFVEKLKFFSSTFQTLFTTFTSLQSVGIILFSVSFGINTSLFVFILRQIGIQKVPKKSSSIAIILAVLGGGCVACGTSLLAPLAATIGATSTVAVQQLGAIFLWLGILLNVYSISRLSLLVSTSSLHKKTKV